MRFAHWFTLRRVRTTLIAGVLLVVMFFLSRSIDVRSRLNIAVPHHPGGNQTETGDEVKWSDFAYVQYVTNENYLCNSLMILEALHRRGTKADRIMMYPDNWQPSEDTVMDGKTVSELLAQARDRYQAKLVPIQVQSFTKGDPTWKDSYTKLLAFNQTQYKRVMSLDSDATVLDHMDELFRIPSSPVAMPRAYWLDQPFLSSQLVLLEPSSSEWQRVQELMDREDSGFDMDVLNTLYKDSCMILPHRRYNLLSAEFKADNHTKYLGSDEVWDGPRILQEAKFIHFSDWPMPKPWLKAPDSSIEEFQPRCRERKEEEEPDCTDRDIWLNLYKDFSVRRQQVCGRSYDEQRAARSTILPPVTPPNHKSIAS